MGEPSTYTFSPQGTPEIIGLPGSAGLSAKPGVYDLKNGRWVFQNLGVPFADSGGVGVFWSPTGNPVVAPSLSNTLGLSTAAPL